MNNEVKEEVIILLTEARNKITKSNILYQRYKQDNVYLETIAKLIDDELADLTKKEK